MSASECRACNGLGTDRYGEPCLPCFGRRFREAARKSINKQIFGDYTPTKTLAENGSILDRLKLVRKRIESARRSGDASMLYVPIDVLDEVIREMSEKTDQANIV